MKYKIAYSGINVTEVEADSREKAIRAFWQHGFNELYNAEIEEVVEISNPFTKFTDLNG